MAVNNFSVMGKNFITIANMILNNQDLCKLLYYTTKNPLSEDDFDTENLMDKNVRVKPKLPNFETEEGSFIIIFLDSYIVDKDNGSFKAVTLRFDIISPFDLWGINGDTLRPFAIMSKLEEIFNGLKIQGIGKLRLSGGEKIVLSENEGGFSMVFTNYEFN